MHDPNTDGPGAIDIDEFRADVRAFLLTRYPVRDPEADDERDDIIGRVPDGHAAAVEAARELQRALASVGLSGLHVPAEYGGRGLPRVYQRVLDEELRRVDAPSLRPLGIGMHLAVNTLLASATEEQKRRYLPALVSAEEQWCKLFSEPDAGSDLVSLRTRAVRDGDEWVVDGQKVWSSYAHLADLGQLMARTDPDVPKHQGISMFLLPMDTPGVEPRPLRQMNGNAEFNEVFLTGVRVPHANLVGDAGAGWRAVLTTLMSERRAVGSGSASTLDPVQLLTDLARHVDRAGDPVVRQELARAHTNRHLLRWLGMRMAESVATGAALGPEGSIMKLLANANNRLVGGLAGTLLGPAMTADSGEWGTYAWANFLCSAPGLRIAGGTDEIQHNILGERVLGLPRDPS